MKTKLVRYTSPFGSPAWMSPNAAANLLAEDLKLAAEMRDAGADVALPFTEARGC